MQRFMAVVRRQGSTTIRVVEVVVDEGGGVAVVATGISSSKDSSTMKDSTPTR